MLRDAAELGLIEQVPWPDAKRGAKAKSEMGPRPRRAEAYPSLDRLRGIIRAMGNDQPASVGYQALSALCLYAGLRPGEAVALRVEDFENIDATFTHVEITRAWHGVAGDKWNSPDERISKPKTERSVRSVLVPRPAMSYVQRWCRRSGITEGRIFVTRTGGRPKQSNWTRALANACEKAGWPTPLTPYDLRRVHASELVRWVSITEAAERLGHSVDVLTKNYLRPIEEDRPEGVLVGWDAFLDLIDMHYEERLWEGGEAQAVSVEGEAW
jgi:integrase